MSQSWPSVYQSNDPVEDLDNHDMYEYDVRRDALLFAIETTESMLSWQSQKAPDTDQVISSCPLLETIKVAYRLMKKKIISNPKDLIGIFIFNTESGSKTDSNSWKSCTFLQDLKPIDAPSLKKLKALIEKFEKNHDDFNKMFAVQNTQSNQITEALRASLNRFRECVPKGASKRLFWITDNPDPFPKSNEEENRRKKMCMAMSQDLMETGIRIEPFFKSISKPLGENDFYSALLDCHSGTHIALNLDMDVFFEKLLKDASMREIERRSAFKIPFNIGDGLQIGISGFTLIAEEKRKGHILVDPHTSTNEQVKVLTEYIDADSTAIVPKQDIINFFSIGNPQQRETFRRVIFTDKMMRKILTLGLDTGLTLLGFRPKDELKWKDHLKHSYYIYPNEDTFIGSTKAFSALLHSMAKKEKIGFGLLRSRQNDTPTLVAILPQLEIFEEETLSQIQPPGMHLCILPWADDTNPPPTVEHLDCFKDPSEDKNDAIRLAEKIVRKLRIHYAPHNIRNPALQYHYDFLAAKYLNEPFVPEADQSLPWYSLIKKRCGDLIKEFKEEVDKDPRAAEGSAPSGASLSKKRRRIEDGEGVDVETVELAFANNIEKALTVQQLKEYLIFNKKLKTGVKAPLKAELLQLARDFLVSKGKVS